MPSEPLTVTISCLDLPEFKALHAAVGKLIAWTLEEPDPDDGAMDRIYREMIDAYFAVSGIKPRAYDYPLAG